MHCREWQETNGIQSSSTAHVSTEQGTTVCTWVQRAVVLDLGQSLHSRLTFKDGCDFLLVSLCFLVCF